MTFLAMLNHHVVISVSSEDSPDAPAEEIVVAA